MVAPLLALAYAASKKVDQNRRRKQAKDAAEAEKDKNAPRYFGYDENGKFIAGVKSNTLEYQAIKDVTHFSVGGGDPQKLEKPFTPQPVYWDRENKTQVSAAEYLTMSQGKLDSGSFVSSGDLPGIGLRIETEAPTYTIPDMSNIVKIGMTTRTGVDYLPSEMLESVMGDDDEDSYTVLWNGKPWGTGVEGLAAAQKARAADTSVAQYQEISTISPNGVVSTAFKEIKKPEEPAKIYYGSEYIGEGNEGYETALARAAADGKNAKVIRSLKDDVLKVALEKPEPEDPPKGTVYRVGDPDDPDNPRVFLDISAAKRFATENNVPLGEIEIVEGAAVEGTGEDRKIVSSGGIELFEPPEEEDPADTAVEQAYVPRKMGGEDKYVYVNVSDLTPAETAKYAKGEYRVRLSKNDGKEFTKGEFPSGSKSSNASQQSAINLSEFSGGFVETVDADGEPTTIGFGFATGSKSEKDPSIRVGSAIQSVLKHPEAFIKLQSDPLQYAAFLDAVSNQVMAAYQKDSATNIFTGVTPQLPVEVLSITRDYAMKKFAGLSNIPGIEKVLTQKFDERLNFRRTFAESTATEQTGAGMTVENTVEIPDPDDPNGTVTRNVIMGVAYNPKYKTTIELLSGPYGLSKDTIASFMIPKEGAEAIDVDGSPVTIMAEEQPVMEMVQQMISTPFYFTDNEGRRRQGSLFDAFAFITRPEKLRQFKNMKVSPQIERDLAGMFIDATEGNALYGIRLLENLAPFGSNIAGRVLNAQYGTDNVDKLSLGGNASATAAGTAFGTLNNIRATYFLPNPMTGEPDPSRPIDLTMAAGEFVLGVDGIVYLLDKAGEFVRQGFGSIIPQEQVYQRALASVAQVRMNVMPAEQAARSVEEGGRGQSVEANQAAARRNQALLEQILDDLQSDAMDTVTINGQEQEIARKLIAARRLYKYLSAYQMAAAIQGGTGGRTISDQDVENMLSAFNFTTISTPKAELATLDAAMGMMKRIRDVNGAIGSPSKLTRYAGFTYERLEGAAQGTGRVTVYRDVLNARDYLAEPGATQRGGDGSQPTVTVTRNDFNTYLLSVGESSLSTDQKPEDHPRYDEYLQAMQLGAQS